MFKQIRFFISVSLILVITLTSFSFAEISANNTSESYIVGYSESKKNNIFGSATDDQISEILSENITKLREANENGTLDTEIKLIQDKGLFCIINGTHTKTNEINIAENEINLFDIGDRFVKDSIVYLVELHFMDNGWQKGEYETTIEGTYNSYNSTSRITRTNTKKTGRFPYVHINGGVHDERIYGNRATIYFKAFDLVGASMNTIDLLLTSNGYLYVS